MSCTLLNGGVRFKAGTAGYSPWCFCPCPVVKAGPDRSTAGLERSWFCSTRGAEPWTLLWPLTQQPGDHCFLWLENAVDCLDVVLPCLKKERKFSSLHEELTARQCTACSCQKTLHISFFSVLAERERLDELNLFNPPSSNHICFYMTEFGMQEFLKLAESITLISCSKCSPLSPPLQCIVEVCPCRGWAELDAAVLKVEHLCCFVLTFLSPCITSLRMSFGMLMPLSLQLFILQLHCKLLDFIYFFPN